MEYIDHSHSKDELFASIVQEWAHRAHENALTHGWWHTDRNDGELIALMHSELSEGLEALRESAYSDHLPGFLGIEEEMADVIIRIFDFCGARRLKLGEAIVAKMAFNKTRPFKHGKNF